MRLLTRLFPCLYLGISVKYLGRSLWCAGKRVYGISSTIWRETRNRRKNILAFARLHSKKTLEIVAERSGRSCTRIQITRLEKPTFKTKCAHCRPRSCGKSGCGILPHIGSIQLSHPNLQHVTSSYAPERVLIDDMHHARVRT
jgi:hypothetical protein